MPHDPGKRAVLSEGGDILLRPGPFSVGASGNVRAIRSPAYAGASPVESVAATAAERAARWRTALVALGLVLAWILASHARTATGMAGIWARSDTFAHGFLVAPISLWLIWRRREALAELMPRPSWWALVPLALASFGWLLGDVTVTNAVAQFAFVALLVLAVPAVLGLEVTRAILFPLAFLFFMVPFGEFLMPRLMEWTADFTVAALQATGIPVYRQGQRFEIPTGSWSVVEACSGIRYLIASVVVGTLYAYLTYRTPRRRWLFVGFSILVPIVANWLRAYLIVLLGHYSGNTIAVGVDHLIYGWAFFGVVILFMFWVGSRWREDEPATAEIVAATRASVQPSAATPHAAFWIAATLVAAVVAAPVAYARYAIAGTERAVALRLPAEIAGWREQGVPARPFFKPAFQGASAEEWRVFARDGRKVALYLGYYENQDAERKMLSSNNQLARANDSVVNVVGSRPASVALAGAPVGVRASDVRVDGARVSAVDWYWIDGTPTASPIRAKWATAVAQLVHRRDASAVVIVQAQDEPPGSGEKLLAEFARDAWPGIASTLSKVAGHGPAR